MVVETFIVFHGVTHSLSYSCFFTTDLPNINYPAEFLPFLMITTYICQNYLTLTLICGSGMAFIRRFFFVNVCFLTCNLINVYR
jgi:hypothetical protein